MTHRVGRDGDGISRADTINGVPAVVIDPVSQANLVTPLT
jgi:hypothetical protein